MRTPISLPIRQSIILSYFSRYISSMRTKLRLLFSSDAHLLGPAHLRSGEKKVGEMQSLNLNIPIFHNGTMSYLELNLLNFL